MVYLNLKTNKIHHDLDIEGRGPYLKDYIEVDDMIAPVIKLLNEKGYTTTFSCSGHYEWTLYNGGCSYEDLNNIPSHINILYKKKVFPDSNGNHLYSIIYESDDNRSLYIAFKYGIGLWLHNQELPEGFIWDDINEDCELDCKFCIRYHYKEKDFIPFIKEQVEVIEKLYNWAKELPDRK